MHAEAQAVSQRLTAHPLWKWEEGMVVLPHKAYRSSTAAVGPYYYTLSGSGQVCGLCGTLDLYNLPEGVLFDLQHPTNHGWLLHKILLSSSTPDYATYDQIGLSMAKQLLRLWAL